MHLISFNDLNICNVSRENAPHFTDQMVAECGSTPHSTTMSPFLTLLLRWSFPHTLEQPADLFDALYMRPTPFATLYNHLSVHCNVLAETAPHFIHRLTIVPTHFLTTCGSFRCTVHANTFHNIL